MTTKKRDTSRFFTLTGLDDSLKRQVRSLAALKALTVRDVATMALRYAVEHPDIIQQHKED